MLVLSMHGEQQYAARALKAGASGYLTKDSAAEQLVGAIRKVAAGGVHISEAAAAYLIGTVTGSDAPPHTRLSDREYEVFRLLVNGEGPTDIADKLHLSVKTVSTHKTRILEKMGMQSTAELVRYAVEKKLL
jgi:DNA-binding NarL/FixJ family response regulator